MVVIITTEHVMRLYKYIYNILLHCYFVIFVNNGYRKWNSLSLDFFKKMFDSLIPET